jgi:hypothetical protein
MLSAEAQASGSAAVTARAVARAVDIAPTIEAIQAAGATSLRAIATALNDAAILTPRGQGKWSAVQVKRTLARTRARCEERVGLG